MLDVCCTCAGAMPDYIKAGFSEQQRLGRQLGKHSCFSKKRFVYF